MTATRDRYDNKHKVTRILLADYLVLKELAQRAGGSMAETLHQIITKDLARAELQEVVTPMPALVYRAKPALSVNGQAARHIALSIKPKGGKYE